MSREQPMAYSLPGHWNRVFSAIRFHMHMSSVSHQPSTVPIHKLFIKLRGWVLVCLPSSAAHHASPWKRHPWLGKDFLCDYFCTLGKLVSTLISNYRLMKWDPQQLYSAIPPYFSFSCLFLSEVANHKFKCFCIFEHMNQIWRFDSRSVPYISQHWIFSFDTSSTIHPTLYNSF